MINPPLKLRRAPRPPSGPPRYPTSTTSSLNSQIKYPSAAVVAAQITPITTLDLTRARTTSLRSPMRSTGSAWAASRLYPYLLRRRKSRGSLRRDRSPRVIISVSQVRVREGPRRAGILGPKIPLGVLMASSHRSLCACALLPAADGLAHYRFSSRCTLQVLQGSSISPNVQPVLSPST